MAPFLRYGVIHGDPHLGNYTVAASGEGAKRSVDGVNLFDYGCVRIFPPRFVRRGQALGTRFTGFNRNNPKTYRATSCTG